MGETTPCTNYSDRLLVRNDNKSEITGTRDDAARVRMGGKWRMPTKNEAQELFDRCKWKHTIYKGIWGFCVTGPNSKKIFIPSAGFHARDGLMRGKDGVMLWTSTAYIDHAFDLCLPYHMVIDNKKNSNPPVTLWINAESYDVGMCIRPVVN